MSALEAQLHDEEVDIDALVDNLWREVPVAEAPYEVEAPFEADAAYEVEAPFEADASFEVTAPYEVDADLRDEFGDDQVLEPSDVMDVEIARAGAGLELLADLEPELAKGEPGGPASHEGELEHAEIRFRFEQFVDSEGDDAEPGPASLDALEIEVEATDEEAANFLAQVAAEHDQEDQDQDQDEDENEDEAELHHALGPAANVDPLRVPAWSKANTSVYAFVRGLRGMAQSPLVQLLAIGTMAVCMLLLGTTMLIFQNATRVVHDLGIDTPVTVYMEPGTDVDAALQLRERIAALPEVEAATRISPEQALTNLQEGLGAGSTSTVERGELLAGIDAKTLPESVEVALLPGVEPGFADALAARVQTMEGVEEVSVLGPWVQEVESMLSTLRWLAFGIGALVSLACLAIVWSTIRLGVFARRSEIHILRLVGGTHRFVRGPFVVEGVLQGVLGTALALASLWLVFEITKPFLERGMSLLFAAGSLHFFSLLELSLALCFGAMLGLIGSRAAVARHAQG